MKNGLIVGAVALLVGLAAGFVPQYRKAKALEKDLLAARQQNAGAQLRDLIGQVYVEASEKNYGLAAGTCSRFFEQAREAAAQAADAGARKALEDILATRDKVTAELAKGDAAVMGDLQSLYVKTRQATAGGGGR